MEPNPVKFGSSTVGELMRTLALRFRRVYPSRNKTDRMHWRRRVVEKNDFMLACGAELRALQAQPFLGPVRISLELFFRHGNVKLMDPDNYSPKWLLDVLVRGGLIKNDTSEFIPDGVTIRFNEAPTAAWDYTIVTISDRET